MHQICDIFSTNPNIATVEGTLGKFCDILVSTTSKCMKLVPSKKKPTIKKFTKTTRLKGKITVNTWQRIAETHRRLKSLQIQHVAQWTIVAAVVVPVHSFAA